MQAAVEPGAAPITLIDGEHLVKLLIEHGIGARKETLSVLKFKPDDFASLESETEDENS
jgi:restriction system protein